MHLQIPAALLWNITLDCAVLGVVVEACAPVQLHSAEECLVP